MFHSINKNVPLNGFKGGGKKFIAGRKFSRTWADTKNKIERQLLPKLL